MATNTQENQRFRAHERGPAAAQAERSAAYHAALAEFDRLWETGQSRGAPERMRELLAVIEAFEQA
jgi:hypothetical protein